MTVVVSGRTNTGLFACHCYFLIGRVFAWRGEIHIGSVHMQENDGLGNRPLENRLVESRLSMKTSHAQTR